MEKIIDFMIKLLKGAVLIFLVTSISLFLYTTFTSQTQWFRCPECHNPTQNTTQLCETHNEAGINIESTNISHIVFGLSGSAKTLNQRRQYIDLWWQQNVTRGFIWLDKEPEIKGSLLKNLPPYRVSENWTGFKSSSSQSAVRIARIISETFKLGLPNVRWFVMGDDDTVFFTHNLALVLAKYDHRLMYYVGRNSESVEQDELHSYDTAFGGGGFAISYPLATELVNAMDGCLDRYYNFYGSDQRVSACVSDIGVSLTRELGFHQIDIRGDPYGFLAAHPLAPLVSLHHLDDVKPLFPFQTQLESLRSLIQAYRVDPARTLQQSFCYHPEHKWSVSISWGYTAQIYPDFVSASELEKPLQTFQTWRSWKNGPFTFNTRPGKSDPCEWPVVYFLDLVKEVGEVETISSYKRYVAEPKKECMRRDYAHVMTVERIIVSAMKMDPEKLKKVPRREPCEVSGRLKNGRMYVSI